MNISVIRDNWKKFEKGFGAYMFEARKMGEAIKWNSDDPDMLKDLLADEAKEAEDSLDECIDALSAIIRESRA